MINRPSMIFNSLLLQLAVAGYVDLLFSALLFNIFSQEYTVS